MFIIIKNNPDDQAADHAKAAVHHDAIIITAPSPGAPAEEVIEPPLLSHRHTRQLPHVQDPARGRVMIPEIHAYCGPA
jgi:hypothetical protein